MHREEKALDKDRRSIKLTWTDPDGLLEVRAEAVLYNRFPTVEWVLWFRNIGQRDTLPLSLVEPVAIVLPTGTRRVLHYFKGSDCGANDFRPHEMEMHVGERNRFFNTGARTSDGMMPIFNCDAGNGGGLIVYPLSQAKSVLQQYRGFMDKAPDEMAVWAILRLAPPLPFIPADMHGKPILALPVFYASGGVYVNFMTSDESERTRNAHGPNYDRLARVKRKYDPGNLFRTNQNIRPA